MESSTAADRRLVLFGDQTGNFAPRLKQLLQDATRRATQMRFLEEASQSLKLQICQLSPVEQDGLPLSFNTVHDLLREYNERDERCHPAICSALLCITQLLQIFYYFEGTSYPIIDENTRVVGLCTGSIAAAAFSCCSGLDQLSRLAVPSVSIAFQTSVHVARSGRLSSIPQNKKASWSIALLNTTLSEISSMIDSYDRESDPCKNKMCWVSAVGPQAVTVSGPPTTLEQFIQYLFRQGIQQVVKQLPIFGPYHAPYLRLGSDFAQFLSECNVSSNLLAGLPVLRNVISASTGNSVQADNALDLLGDAVQSIIHEPVCLDLVIEEFAFFCNLADNPCSLTITAVCPTTGLGGIEGALRSLTQAAISIDNFHDLVREWNPSPGSLDAPLAIVGTGCRFPGADTPEELWELLESAQDMHKTIPQSRFDINKHVDPTLKRKNTSSTPYGCFIDQPGQFDLRLFNMSPSEAAQTDPMQRLALMTAYEALEMSGFVPNRTPSTALDRVGTFYGQSSDDYRDTNAAQEIGTYFITGGLRAFGPGRINYYFNLGGPSYNIDTACSSSLTAIHLACASIRSGHCDTAVAGGLSVLTSPDLYAGLSRGHFLSKTGSCKTFDHGADGYCRADGIGTVIIKRLADAQRDNDNILGVVLGTGTNHSAEAVSLTHPHPQTQAKLFRYVIERSGIDPLDVNYVEMHGTGTQAGDSAEVASVVDVVAPFGQRKLDNPLYVGSIKPNIGHGEASAGVASLMKAILMLEKRIIPPHIGIKSEINRRFPDLELANVRISTKSTPFESSMGRERTILVNSFSAAGGNTTLLLQEPPASTRAIRDPRQTYAITVSGHSPLSLDDNLKLMVKYIDANPSILPGDLGYTTMARRMHKGLRVTVTGGTIAEIKQALERRKERIYPPSPASLRPVVFVFTGQGASYHSLAHDLYMTSTQFRSDIYSLSQLAFHKGFSPFISLIDGSITDVNLLSVVQMQVGLVCIQIALARLWRSWGIQPSMVLGHSLGEFAALQTSGVLSISDTVFLVGCRARLLEGRCQVRSHSMLAVSCSHECLGLSPTEMEGVDIACLNSPHETVLAGGVGIIASLEFRLHERGIRTKQLAVPYAFHSAQLDPILGAFGDAIKQVAFERPQVPIISPVTGQLEERIGADYLLRQARQTVQFSPVLERVKCSGALNDRTIFLEIGPHPICSEMIKATLGRDTCTLPTLRRNEDSWAVLVQSLAALHDKGLSVNWGAYYREYEKAHRLLALPSYAFDNSNYWIDYRNDWSLPKGDPPETTINPEKCTNLSDYLHRVVKEEYDGTQATVVYETDLQDEKVHAAISGHRVNGCALCPSSLYATVALDVADHQQNRMKSAQIPLDGRNINHMEVSHPLIVGSLEDEKRVLRTTVELAERHSNIIRVRFSTVASNLEETPHACCFVEFGKQEDWLSEWAGNAYMVQKHLATLDALAALGNSSKITRKLAYRLFQSLVDYAPKYQLMDQVALANSGVEASCKVQLQGENGPHWIDALAHISGFALNANEDTESADFVYISQGWGAMRLGKQLQAGRTYQTYVNMWPQKNGLMDGNVWILSGNAVVGLIEDIQFQKIKRQALNLLLLAPGSSRESANFASPSAMKEPAQQQPHLGLPEGRVKPDTKTQDSYRQLVAEELGLPASQLSDNDHLLNLGLDSLMSLTLTSRLQDEWGIEVSHQFLLECVTIGELLAILDNVTGTGHGGSCKGPDIPQDPTAKRCANGPTRSTDSWTQTGSASENMNKSFTDSEFSFGEAHFSSAQGVALTGDYISDVDPPSGLLFERPDSMHKPSESSRIDTEIDSHEPSAKVILLQRRSNLSSNKQLFLFPDGSGSPASYAQFENLSPDFEVYGLVCPYLKIPQAETNGLAATVGIYISAIREYQPHGPYHLGGWSIGGVYAYEASNRLVQMREHVALLLLIDSPCPSIFPPMNSRLIKFFEALRVFDQMPSDVRGRSPLSKREQVLNHFKIATEDLSDYKPVRAMAGEAAPKVFVFWARNGVCEDRASVRDEDSSTDSAYALDNWILAKRTDFGPCGWEALLPVERLVMRVIPGTHFTMMQSPNIAQISKEIQEILRLL